MLANQRICWSRHAFGCDFINELGDTSIVWSRPDGNLMATGEGDVSRVVAKVSPSVVSILTTKEGTYSDKMGAGTGVIVSSDGYILTNKHVVRDARRVRVVTSNGDQFTNITFVGADPLNDIAFLKINGASNLPVAELGNSGTVKVGQRVVAIGNSCAN